jgi:phosphoribosylformylglycinamidine (FGAM) synthase-like enzyme
MTDQRQPSKPLEVVGWLSTSGYRAVIHEPTRRAMTNKWQPSEAALDAAIERVAQPQHIAISAATDKLRHVLADMHDSAEDGTCLFDAGDGSCLGCKAFEALAELMAAIDRLPEVSKQLSEALEALDDMQRDLEQDTTLPNFMRDRWKAKLDTVLARLRKEPNSERS